MLQIRFRESTLNLSTFMGVNLANTHFDSCPLKEANFTTAYNVQIDPEKNKMKGAKFSKENVAGMLEKYKISIQ